MLAVLGNVVKLLANKSMPTLRVAGNICRPRTLLRAIVALKRIGYIFIFKASFPDAQKVGIHLDIVICSCGLQRLKLPKLVHLLL